MPQAALSPHLLLINPPPRPLTNPLTSVSTSTIFPNGSEYPFLFRSIVLLYLVCSQSCFLMCFFNSLCLAFVFFLVFCEKISLCFLILSACVCVFNILLIFNALILLINFGFFLSLFSSSPSDLRFHPVPARPAIHSQPPPPLLLLLRQESPPPRQRQQPPAPTEIASKSSSSSRIQEVQAGLGRAVALQPDSLSA